MIVVELEVSVHPCEGSAPRANLTNVRVAPSTFHVPRSPGFRASGAGVSGFTILGLNYHHFLVLCICRVIKLIAFTRV